MPRTLSSRRQHRESGSTYTLGSNPSGSVTATVADALSGPAVASLAATVTAADVSVAGVNTKAVVGADRAGNEATAACPYAVAYNFLGFVEPAQRATVKAGATLPVRFRLGDANGPLSDAAATALLRPTCQVQVTFDGVVQGCATYDPLSDRFQYDVKTVKSTPLGTHLIGIRVTSAAGAVLNTNSTTVQVR